VRVNGRACSLDEAAEAAADLLTAARLPLVYGLVDSTVEAQRQAVALADLLRGILDTAASAGRAGATAAYERLGSLTASLGDVRQRAQLVVFWGCDPERAHPGFGARYVPARPGRVRVAVDVGEARGPADAEERLAIPRDREIDALLALRAFVRGRRVEPPAMGGDIPLEGLRALARRLTACGYGAVLTDGDPPAGRRNPELAITMGALVREAHRKARLRLVAVRAPGNAVGAENVLAWQTGFPSAISFARGYPRYGPGEFDAETVLARGDVDAALVVGADPSAHLSGAALERLSHIPTVRVATSDAAGADRSRVFLSAAALGDTAGRVYRMDSVALRQRPRAGTGGAATEADVLARISVAALRRLSESAP
jgi:formylmethanofuran dehydrogenase subunit B